MNTPTTTMSTALERELSGALLSLTPYEAARVGVICRQTAAAAIREATRYAAPAEPPGPRLETLAEAIAARIAQDVVEAVQHVVLGLDGEAAAGDLWGANLRRAARDDGERPRASRRSPGRAVCRALEVLGVLAVRLAAPPDRPARPLDSWECSSWMYDRPPGAA